jgi:hypothetical protein
MKKEFVMRGKTASGAQEILEFGGRQKENKNMAYRITEFTIYPATSIGSTSNELVGSITAGKTAVAPTDPDFDNLGLIATAQYRDNSNDAYQNTPSSSCINDTFMITQSLILMVQDTAGSSNAVNWQCRFEAIKMTDAETAATNFKQYSIFDE